MTEGSKDSPTRRVLRRPPRYSPSQVAAVKAWACQLPTEHELPLSRWSAPELARQLLIEGISASVSTVRRWLAQDVLKPWRYQSWIFVRDPQFETKAAVVLDLYARRYDGVELGADEYVISADWGSLPLAGGRSRPSRPVGAAIARSRPAQAVRCASITTTAVVGHWHIWRPTTCTGRRCSADVKPQPASTRSPLWSTRS
ncbi:helix-turn-helix domain-containing protein [Rhodococcus koreensis]